LREKILRFFLKNCPDGDLTQFEKDRIKLSCVFIFYKRYDLMSNILHCLNSQMFDKKDFEIILLEDKGGSKEGKILKNKFNLLNIKYFAPENNWGKMGFMRNFGLSRAEGEIILFLDDDTVILDNSFLRTLYIIFSNDSALDAVQPKGSASYVLIDGRYRYHDPYFFTNRCMAYRKSSLKKLHGFDSNFIGQEDVELAIRFITKKFKVKKSKNLRYYHPPLILKDTSKGSAVGASFARSKYNSIVKILLFINGIRWLYRIIYPTIKNRNMARFSFGFMLGFFKAFTTKKDMQYV
jgi:GT2 family glycosyltransferase